MKIIKPLKQCLLHKVYETQNKFYLAATIISCFRFDNPELFSEIDLWKFAAAELGKDAILDMCMPKPRGEVLVKGACFPPNGKPAPAYRVHFGLGPISKTLYIFGNRLWKRKNGVKIISDPEPFSKMDIIWENAFGGAEYKKNPVGKGSATIKTETGEDIHPLPNVEDLGNLIGSPADKPEPAGFGPIDLMWPQRFSKVGTYDEKWKRERFPGLADDIDWTYFNAAPSDQWIDGYFKGKEDFEITGMHPTKTVIQAKLPGVKSRCFINHKTSQGTVFKEIETNLDTVWLFPHAERGIVVYRGVTEVNTDDAEDVEHVMVGYERLSDAPKPFEHYLDAFKKRTDRKTGHLHLTNETDLMPAGEKSGLAQLMEDALKGDEGILKKNMARRTERELEKARDLAKKMGLDPDALAPKPQPEPEINLDNLQEASAMMDKKLEEAKAAKKVAENQFKEKLKGMGLDYDKMLKDAKTRKGGPPDFSAGGLIEKLGASGAIAPEILKKLRESQENAIILYRQYVHQMPEVEPPPAEEKSRLREFVISRYKEGKSFANMNLTGADLSNLSLPNINLKDAFMEAADLSGAVLTGANMENCVLVQSKIVKARLDGARMAGANLGRCDLTESIFTKANLDKTVFCKANAFKADFSGARMNDSDLMNGVFKSSVLDGASLIKALMVETDFTDARLVGADARHGNFLNCVLINTDFSNSKLDRAVFVKVKGDNAVFRKASMPGSCAIENTSFKAADFSGANMERAGFRGINIEGSKFNGCRLEMADFSESNLKNSTFNKANAKLARFMKSDLTGCDMSQMNLYMGSLMKAKILNTNLSDSNLYAVEFFRAVFGETNLNGSNLKMTIISKWAPK